MGMTLVGKELIAKALMGDAYTKFDNTNARLGVGNSATAFVDTQTDLLGTNFRRVMEATYPTRSVREITWKASFDASEANFDWLENGVFNAASAGDMLARDVENLGTKASPAVWVFTKKGTIT
jgi:hypothetical protein